MHVSILVVFVPYQRGSLELGGEIDGIESIVLRLCLMARGKRGEADGGGEAVWHAGLMRESVGSVSMTSAK